MDIPELTNVLIESKNLIFHGAPGTGKSYLAKEIAAYIISNGEFSDYNLLTDEQKNQVEFVQFHPSYDYSDFVEGLRPKLNVDGTMGFELKDGIFKQFVDRARQNYESFQKSRETVEREQSVREAMKNFFADAVNKKEVFKTKGGFGKEGTEFTITSVYDNHISISIPGNEKIKELTLSIDNIKQMFESGKQFETVSEVRASFDDASPDQKHSYYFAVVREILKRTNSIPKTAVKAGQLKKYVFIIDEINRGEISKIFGELFFSIDPGYRGRAGEISTQYSNMHKDPKRKFYIPDNVYIIGTMNDIDRSVDTFDFAMRRRFRFVEIKANEHLEMLKSLGDEALKAKAIKRMTALNKAIVEDEDAELNENYQIGASYFLKLKTLDDFDWLWTDYLEPLLREYIHGMNNENGIMRRFEKAYGYGKKAEGDVNEAAQDNG